MDRQMDRQAKNKRAPPTRWRGTKYILGHTDVLINDKYFFCECQYLYILRRKITITLTFIKTLDYRFHGSRTTLRKPRLKYTNKGAMVHRRLVYMYLLNVPNLSSRYFNKIKGTSRLGRLLA